MKKNFTEIEIPFGVKDSELYKKQESEDERIRKEIVDYFSQFKDDGLRGVDITPWIAYLEKQKEEAQRQFNLGMQAGREEVMYEAEKEQKTIQSKNEKEYVRILKSIIADFIRDKKPEDVSFYQQIYDWLDGRHIEQKPTEWSEEDEGKLSAVISLMKSNSAVDPFYDKMCLEGWLKSLSPQPKRKGHLGVKDQWCCSAAWAAVRDSDAYNGEEKQFILDFLQRCESQPHWKPSEEQMAVLYDAISNLKHDNYKNIHVLESLYNDLQKLL